VTKKQIAYWVITTLLVFSVISGGVAELMRLPGNVDGMARLGYPLYFLAILGFWKVLAGIALVVPRFPRLKEWAYAGVFFNMTGAAASHIIADDFGAYAFHVFVTLSLAALTIASWATRPQSRILGTLWWG